MTMREMKTDDSWMSFCMVGLIGSACMIPLHFWALGCVRYLCTFTQYLKHVLVVCDLNLRWSHAGGDHSLTEVFSRLLAARLVARSKILDLAVHNFESMLQPLCSITYAVA